MIMNIRHQMKQVLKSINQRDLHFLATQSSDFAISMTDIQHGNVYTNILRSLKHGDQPKFISLTCNIDGVAVYTSS